MTDQTSARGPRGEQETQAPCKARQRQGHAKQGNPRQTASTPEVDPRRLKKQLCSACHLFLLDFSTVYTEVRKLLATSSNPSCTAHVLVFPQTVDQTQAHADTATPYQNCQNCQQPHAEMCKKHHLSVSIQGMSKAVCGAP